MQLYDSSVDWRHIFRESFPKLDQYEALYKDLHQHPELPCQEERTSGVVARHLETLGFEVERHVGGHGVIGIHRNGSGRNVLIRSELDALPLQEATGLPYASKVQQVDADGCTKWVMHGCGHDMHMATLLAAADLLLKAKMHWTGTLICVFQPNEERLLGAQAMIDDGLFQKIPRPDILLGQHAVRTKAGTIGIRAGRSLGFLDSLEVRVYGKGTHSSTPQVGIDPILMASCIVARLQQIVGREIDYQESCVITCGSFHAGTDASIIPEYADFKVDIRSFNKSVQLQALQAVRRLIKAECQASKSPKEPRIVTAASCPPIDNDEESMQRFETALHRYYGEEAESKVMSMKRDITADDFVLLSHPPGQEAIPYIYWNYGVTPRGSWDKAEKEGTIDELPCNHNPRFAPEIEPSLHTGIEGLAIAAVEFFRC